MYGFTQIDYVRFVNMLLDLSMESSERESNIQDEEARAGLDYEDESGQHFNQLPIEGKRIRIRKLDPVKDVAILKEWLRDKSGRLFLLSRITAQTINIDRIINDDWNVFGIVTTLEDIPIGCVAYLGYNSDQKKAELRKLIGEPSMRGKGYAKEASQLWIKYGLDGLNLKKIHLSTLHTDIRNIRLNESLGFKVEGILRNEICVDGVYRDVLRMSLWRD
jgi:RimJ/RimL family protein N-acetyltransferase